MLIAIVTDIHAGEPAEAKYGPGALPLLRSVLVRAEERAQAVVDLGDHVNNESAARDFDLLREVGDVLDGCGIPLHALAGNHDLKNLPSRDVERALGRELGSRTVYARTGFDGGMRLILWAADVSFDANGGFRALESDVAWLDGELRSSPLPAVVFSHVPFGGASAAGNYYFGHRPRSWAEYAQAEDIRRVIEESERCVACVAGHVHRNTVQVVDGIPYLTVQSLTETSTTAPAPAGAWALLEKQGASLCHSVFGRDPLMLQLPLKDPRRHWLTNPELMLPCP
jgi:Icc protein